MGVHWTTYQDLPERFGSSLVVTGLTRRVLSWPCCHEPTGIHWLLLFWTGPSLFLVADYLAGLFAKFYSYELQIGLPLLTSCMPRCLGANLTSETEVLLSTNVCLDTQDLFWLCTAPVFDTLTTIYTKPIHYVQTSHHVYNKTSSQALWVHCIIIWYLKALLSPFS